MKKAFIYINYSNIVVLETYLKVVSKALARMGFSVEETKTMVGVPKASLIVFPMGVDAFKYFLKGYKSFILWQQGVTGEESFLRHRSKLRRFILNWIDLFCMRRAKLVLFVSEQLLRYYQKKMKDNGILKKSVIMPCFNESSISVNIEQKDYSRLNFCYVGSLAPWQCFEDVARVYKRIEEFNPEASLKVLTFDCEKAKSVLKKHGVKNYNVKCVPKEDVVPELCDQSYGFIIRKKIVVNEVSTPTKFSSYLSAGVLPIYSDCMLGMHSVLARYSFSCPIDLDDLSSVLSYIQRPKDSFEISEQIALFYKTFYDENIYIKQIVFKLGETSKGVDHD